MQDLHDRSIVDALQSHTSQGEAELMQAWTKSHAYFYRSIAAIRQLWQVRWFCTLPSQTLSALSHA